MRNRVLWLTLFGMSVLGEACNKKDKADSTTSTTDEVTQANVLALAYPQTLALSVFPETATGLRLADEAENPYGNMNVKEKIEENKRILKGDVDACIPPGLFGTLKGPPAVTCYEFDSDMNPSKFSGDTREFGTKDGTDGKGEACMVAFTRSEVQDAVNTVDRALALVAGVLCQAKKDGASTEMPAIGGKLDLATSLTTATNGFMTAEQAEISRLDDIDGNPVYRTDLVLKDANSKEMEVHLVHSPGADDAATGTLWFLHHPPAAQQENDPNNTANKNFVMSINYERKKEGDETRMRYEVRRAAIVNTIEPFTAAGLVNYDGIPEDAQNDKVHAINYVAFDMNPDTNAGSLAYWQNPGGSYNESARGFLFKVEADSDGKLSGCGVSGATSNVSIRKALKEPSETNTLAPTRYWHPRENQNIHPDKDTRYDQNEGNKITEQCFGQNDDGTYAIDTTKTDDAHGYKVIAGTATDVKPPKQPEAKLEGEFQK